MIHRDERSAKASAYADAKMQMVAEYCTSAALSTSDIAIHCHAPPSLATPSRQRLAPHACHANPRGRTGSALTTAGAQQFNQKSPAQHKVAFVVAQVLELPSRQGAQRWSSLEPLHAGEYK